MLRNMLALLLICVTSVRVFAWEKSAWTNQAGIEEQCVNSHSITCHSPSEVTKLISDLKDEIRRLNYDDIYGRNNCTVCFSNPCLNGGSCTPLSMSKYRCDCLDDYSGANCQTHVECKPNSCGVNADCYVQNHQVNCVCKFGYAGNPKTGCSAKVRQTCHSGDPHYNTFDGQYFEYQGTCPFIFLEPCLGHAALPTFGDFSVKAKNTIYTGEKVSHVTEVELSVHGHSLHVDDNYNAHFDGVRVSMPYYYPDRANPTIWVTSSGGTMTIGCDLMITIVFSPSQTTFCLSVPDVPELYGADTLCGLAGNIDDNCKDDFRFRNGYRYTNITSCQNRYMDFTELFGDSYITQDFLAVKGNPENCLTGMQVTNGSLSCPDLSVPKQKCQPIEDAASGLGPFAACQALGPNTIANYYENCYYDVCVGSKLCDVLSDFVTYCQLILPNTPLDWRNTLGCDMYCAKNSKPSPCAPGCPLTCLDKTTTDVCDKPCKEGCVCDPGYVLEGSNPATAQCIEVEDCGCVDPQGNYHTATDRWLTDDCNVLNYCLNGTYHSEVLPCSTDASCIVDGDHKLKCECHDGFNGDGYNCTDIDECLDLSTCNQDLHHGVCTNIPGSHECTCDVYYDDGGNCDKYLPLRHCADLFRYHNKLTSGIYTIYPPYALGGRLAYSAVDVYCNMELKDLDGTVGGWTLMSNALSNLMAGKKYAEYVDGFGDPVTQDLWIGLDFIYKMTTETNTSLRVDLATVRPTRKSPIEVFSYCTYETFSVLDASNHYAVVLNAFSETSYFCTGSYGNPVQDPWMTWSDIVGPGFYAFDNVPDEDTEYCTSVYNNTGWWYDTNAASICGRANLNGNRYDCGHNPLDEIPKKGDLTWDGATACEAHLYLRPTDFPDYDIDP